MRVTLQCKKESTNFESTDSSIYLTFSHCNSFFSFTLIFRSVSKLLSRIVEPEAVLSAKEGDEDEVIKKLHEHTYGITSDPMTQFAAVVAALIHDVDHTGVPNAQLVKEGTRLAELYKNKSVAEQNSIELAWDLLMDNQFKDLRAVIFTNEKEEKHFRALLVNLVLATDICDKELVSL